MERFEHGGNVWAHPGCVDFSANLNPLGMPTAAREALRSNVDKFERYPDPASTELVDALSAAEGVPRPWVVACAGATDAFARVCAVLRPRRALVCAPCYSGYEQALAQAGADVVAHLLSPADDFALGPDFARAIDNTIDLVFLANPNNPTGRCVERAVLLACLERAQACGAHVVLDECFADLTGRASSVELLCAHPHLVLVKAFTKTYALAGLRLGYALCSDEALAWRLREAGQPWSVSAPAQIAGVACLADEGYLARSRELVAHERARLADALAACGLRAIGGEANYLLFQGPSSLDDALLAHGILIRSCANYRGLDQTWHRVAVRTPHENDALIAALGEVLR